MTAFAEKHRDDPDLGASERHQLARSLAEVGLHDLKIREPALHFRTQRSHAPQQAFEWLAPARVPGTVGEQNQTLVHRLALRHLGGYIACSYQISAIHSFP